MLAIPYPRKAILFVLFAIVAVTAIGGAAFAIAQSQRTANVEVRVWEDVNDPERNYISARPEGGSWSTLGTIRLPLTDGVSSSGRFRYGDITLAVPLPDPGDDEGCAAAVELAKATADVSIISCVSWEGIGGRDLYGVLSYNESWYAFVADIHISGVEIDWEEARGSPACKALTRFYGPFDFCFASASLSWETFEDGKRAAIEWIASGGFRDRGTRIDAHYLTDQTFYSVDEITTTQEGSFDERTTITKRTSICGGFDTPDC